jgi:tight adherence protein B
MSDTLLIILAAVLAFIAIAGLGFVFAGGNPHQERMIKRAQAIAVAAPRDSRRARGPMQNTPEIRRKQILKSLKEQERQQKKARTTLVNKLHQAGLNISVVQFWCAGGGFGLTMFVVLLLLRINPFVALGLGGAMALGLPLWVVGFLAKRRTAKFTSAFSDAMDIIVRGIKSGLPVHDCLKIIARESPEPLRSEFNRLVENIGMGLTLDQALDKLNERMPTSEVRFFSIVMNIQQKTGGNLAEALNNLSMVLRSRKLMREKIKALSSEATASALIIGSMPPGVILMITVTTPAYMQPMYTDHRGWLMLGGGALWMGLGVFVMSRMINFKF